MVNLIEVELPPEHTVVLGGDDHIGNRACSYDTIFARKKRILDDPNCFHAHMGDVGEVTPIDHKNFTIDQIVPPPGHPKPLITALEQYAYFEQIYQGPLAERTMTVLQGNHDWRLNNSAGNFLLDSCRRLGIPYGTNVAKLAVYVGKQFRRLSKNDKLVKQRKGVPDYQMFLWHGNGGLGGKTGDLLRRQATRRVNLRGKLEPLAADCDVMAMGHVHQLDVAEYPNQNVLVSDNTEIKALSMRFPPLEINVGGQTHRIIHPDSRIYAVTGTALKNQDYDPENPYSTYSEKSGYPPTDLGWVEIDYKDGHLSAKTHVLSKHWV